MKKYALAFEDEVIFKIHVESCCDADSCRGLDTKELDVKGVIIFSRVT
jgi:hypothetical protein